MARMPNNSRLMALGTAAQRVARGICEDRGIRVVLGGSPKYDWKAKIMTVPSCTDDQLRLAGQTLAGDLPEGVTLADVYRGMQDHEMAHVLLSDFDYLDEAIERWSLRYGPDAAKAIFSLANALEDGWIEGAHGRSFPGAVANLKACNLFFLNRLPMVDHTDPNYCPPPPAVYDYYGNFVRAGVPKPVGPWAAFSMACKWAKLGFVESLSDFHPETVALIGAIGDDLWQEILDAQSTQAVGEVAEKVYLTIRDLGKGDSPADGQDQDGQDQDGQDQDGQDQDGQDGQGQDQDGQDGQGQDQDGQDGQGQEGQGQDGQGQDGQGQEGQGQDGQGQDGQGQDGQGQEGQAGEEDRDGQGFGGVGGHLPSKDFGPVQIEGDFGEFENLGDVLASHIIKSVPPDSIPPYTIHPAASSLDRVVEYDAKQREVGSANLPGLQEAAGVATQRLVTMMRGAIQSTRQERWVGALEEGLELDPDAIGSIAQGINGPDVMRDRVRTVAPSTGVVVLVDCSGSMGSSAPTYRCKRHPRRWGSKPCCAEAKASVEDPAGYAAITAQALHAAFRTTRTPHAVLGYTTSYGVSESSENMGDNPVVNFGGRSFRRWSRQSSGLEMHKFVEAPGIHDKGDALPYIDGRSNNLDGESVLWAARYGAEHFGHLGRVIMLVIADGLPAGTDCHMIQGPYLQKVVDMVARAGIEVYGLGVGIADFDVFSSYYPNIPEQPGRAPTGSIEIKSGEGLSDTTLRAMIDLIMMGRGATRTLRRA